MKVRILSGNQAGLVVEQNRDEAESNIATGYAELVNEETPPEELKGKPGARPKGRRDE